MEGKAPEMYRRLLDAMSAPAVADKSSFRELHHALSAAVGPADTSLKPLRSENLNTDQIIIRNNIVALDVEGGVSLP